MSKMTGKVKATKMIDMEQCTTLTVKEFRELGCVQEINRRVLHPIGLALEIRILPNGEEEFGRIWDSRDDPESFVYGDGINEKKSSSYYSMMQEKMLARLRRFGWIEQPISDTQGPDNGD